MRRPRGAARPGVGPGRRRLADCVDGEAGGGDGADERRAQARGADDGTSGSGGAGLRAAKEGGAGGGALLLEPRVPSRRGCAPTLGVADAYVHRLTPRPRAFLRDVRSSASPCVPEASTSAGPA